MRVYLVRDLELIAESDAAAQRLWPGAWSFVRPCDPPAPAGVPSVTMAQARIALSRAGISEADVADAIGAIPDGQAKTEARIWWECAGTVERSHPTVAQLAAALGLSDSDVDGLFLAAAAI